LNLTIDILNEIDDCEIIFKAKNSRKDILRSFFDERRSNIYLEKINYLLKNKRFNYFDNTFPIESFIPVSDIVVDMGLSSPSTIALISGKEAIYFDLTGNDQHPFVKYKNKVVFDDKRLLIEQIKAILEKKDSVFNYIDRDLLHKYESCKDQKALERLISEIYKETIS